jgi:hypothetical protein
LLVVGDEFRATGNIAGMAAGAMLGTVGRGLGGGVSGVTHVFGKGIEEATGLVGARKLGSGVNTVISGVGDGVGHTLSGGKNQIHVSMDPFVPLLMLTRL